MTENVTPGPHPVPNAIEVCKDIAKACRNRKIRVCNGKFQCDGAEYEFVYHAGRHGVNAGHVSVSFRQHITQQLEDSQ